MTTKKISAFENAIIEPKLVKDLLLDPKNPRLVEVGLGKNPTQDEITKLLWDNMAVNEIALSISENGYFEYEPVFVTKENGHYYVIEGNRRLAAVKLLLDKKLQIKLKVNNLPTISKKIEASLQILPVIVTDRKKIWQYLGFRHVNGPQEWESFAKAKYIASVHNDFKVSLKDIASQIGDTNQTVNKLYNGIMVLEQAEDKGLFSRDDRYRRHFSFSHLYTIITYAGTKKFLGLKDDTIGKRNPVPSAKNKNLKLLHLWLYGSKLKELPPIIVSQNPDLRILDEVLQSKDGVAALGQGLPLATSMNISRGDDLLFREAIIGAKKNLEEARAKFINGFSGEKDLVKLIESISQLAQNLLQETTQLNLMKKSRTNSRAK